MGKLAERLAERFDEAAKYPNSIPKIDTASALLLGCGVVCFLIGLGVVFTANVSPLILIPSIVAGYTGYRGLLTFVVPPLQDQED